MGFLAHSVKVTLVVKDSVNILVLGLDGRLRFTRTKFFSHTLLTPIFANILLYHILVVVVGTRADTFKFATAAIVPIATVGTIFHSFVVVGKFVWV